jgi:hypothetical protein
MSLKAVQSLLHRRTRVNAYINGSTTIPKTYTANTFTALQTFNNGATIGTLTGPIQAQSGVISATTSVGVVYGGTGLTAAPSFGQMLVGNSSSGYTQTATSALGLLTTNVNEGSNLYYTDARVQAFVHASTTIPKTYTANTFTALQTLTGGLTIGTLTGPLQAQSGVVSASSSLSVIYGGTGVTNPTAAGVLLGSYGGGTYQQLATSALAIAISDTTGTLAATRGGTGLSTITNNQLLVGGPGNTVTQIATSSLGLLTTNVAEGTNQYYTDARVNAYINGSTTIPKTYTSNTFTGAQTFSGGVTIGSLVGPLQAQNGLVSATTSVGVTYGGTGLTSAPTFGQILVGNASNGYTLTATSALGLPTSAITSLAGQFSTGQTGATQTFATSSDTNIGLTITSTNNVHTFTPSWIGSLAAGRGGTGITSPSAAGILLGSYAGGTWQQLATSALAIAISDTTGTLAVNRGGTNITNPTAAGVLVGSYAGGSYQQIATSSLGLLTTNVAEGSNLYYTDVRVNSYINGSTTIPKTYSANTFTGAQTFTGGVTIGSLTGPLQAVNGVVSASSTLAAVYGGTGTSNPTAAGILLGTYAGGAWQQLATSSLGIAISDTTGTLAVSRGGTNITSPSAAGVLLGSYAGGTYQQLATSSLGLLTTNVAEGSNLYYTDTRVNTYINASTTIPKTYTANTFSALQTFNNGVTIGSLAGPLQAQSGVISATTSVGVVYGGTGLTSAPSFGQILVGNSSSGYTLTATSALGLFSAIGPTAQTQTGPTVTIATSSDTNIGLTVTGANNTLTFTSNWIGSLAAGRGGTGITNPTAAGILLGSYAGGSWQQLATSSLGLLTTNVAEGSNLYYTDTRVNTYINGSTTIPKTYTANTFTALQTFNNGATIGTLTGPIQAQSGVVSATTSVGVTYGGTGLTSAPSLGQILVGNSSSGYTLTATSALGLITSIGPTGQTQSSPTITIATSTSSFNGHTIALTVVGSANTLTFTPTLSGTLTAGGGGTGITNPTAAGVVLGSYAGGTYQQLATSSLGLLTTNVAEGSNLYYTDARVQAFVHASTTIPKTYTANTFTALQTLTGGLTVGTLTGPLQAQSGVVSASSSLSVIYGGTGVTNPTAAGILLGSYAGGTWQQLATSTLGLLTTNVAEGSNLYYTDTRVNTYIHGSTTIPKTYTANTFSALQTLTGGLTVGTLAGPLQAQSGVVSATTSVGVTYGGTGLTSAPTFGQILVGNSSSGYTLTATSALGLITAIGPTGQTQSSPTITFATSTSSFNGHTIALTIVGSSNSLTFTPSLSGTLTAGGGGTGISNPTAAGVVLGSYAGGSYQQLATSSLGLLTTNVAEGNNLYYTDTRVNTYINGSTTIPKTYTANIFTGAQTFNGGVTIGTLAGPLQAQSGVVSASSTIVAVYGGTGTSNPTAAGILLGSYAGGTWQQLGTSSLGLLTTNVAEGSNLYYTDTRVNTYINGSTTIPKTYSANTFTGLQTFSNGVTIGTLTGPLQAQSGVVSASTSLSVVYGGTGISNPSAAGVVLGSYAGGTYQQLATSSLGLLTTNVAEGTNQYYTDARVNTYVNGSTTIPKTYTANTFTGIQTFSALTNLAQASSTLESILNGIYIGTTATTTIFGNKATSTFSGGISTDLLNVSSTTATSTFANGINITSGCFAVGGSCLSASVGSGITSLAGQFSTGQTGATQTFATSSDTNIGLVITSAVNVHTFTPTWIGSLAAGRGGTGITSPTAAGILLGSYAGGSYQQLATSSLGLLTTNIAEGSNLYYTDTRVNTYINASTTIPKTYTANTFTALQTLTGGLTVGTLTGPLQAQSGVVSASSSLSVIYGGTGVTNPTAAGILLGSYAGGTWQQLATSTLGLLTTNVAEGSNQYFTNGRAQSATGWIDNGTTVTLVTNSDNVGVGTSSPFANLTIWGGAAGNILEVATIASSTALRVSATGFGTTTLSGLTVNGSASSTSNVGINLSGGCFAISGSCVGGGSVSGGTAGMLTAWTSSSALTATSGPTFAYFTATSSTATSTIAGQINIASSTAGGAGIISINGNRFIHDYGTENTFVGLLAGNTSLTTTSAIGNVAVGPYTLKSLTTGDSNIAIGNAALTNLTTGFGNMGIGKNSGTNIGIGVRNIGIGHLTLENISDGAFNTAIGYLAGRQLNTTSSNNVAIGGEALLGNFGIVNNTVALGYFTGHSVTTGSNNIFLGYQAGDAVTTGSNNIIIGYDIDATSTTATGQLNIGNLLFGIGLNGTGTTLSTGNIGIGTTTPANLFSVAGSSYLGNSSTSVLTVHSGTVNYPVISTTTLTFNTNAWSIATSTTGGNPVLSISFGTTTGATSTIGFFVATTTGLNPGVGLSVSSALQNYIIVGNGKKQAGIGIVNGGLCVDNDGWCAATTTGRISAVTSTVGASDIAEMYNSSDSLLAGEIVSSASGISVQRATKASEYTMIGIVSTEPGIILGLPPDAVTSNQYPIALTGRVPVKVNLDGGNIAAGDPITISSTPGVGMKATTTSRTIGYALESYDQSSTSGVVTVFVLKNTYFNQNQFTIDDTNGNVGIGTTSPYAKFAVAGQIVGAFFTGTTTATSTLGGGMNITTGCFAINNVCLSTGGAGSTPGGPAGALQFNSGSSFSGDAGLVWDNTNKHLGIGTSTPDSALAVSGNTHFDSNTISFASSTARSLNLNFLTSATTTVVNGLDNVWSIATSTNNVPIFSISTKDSPVGLVGIGSSTPWGKLSVEMGTYNPSFVVSNQGSSTPAFIVTGVNQNGRIGIGTSTPLRSLDVNGTFGGNAVISNQGVTSNGTITLSTPAFAYTVSNYQGTTNTSVTETFNITGLPNIEGTFAVITSQAGKGVSTGAQRATVAVQINGTQVGTVFTPSQTAAASTTKNYMVVRTNNAWRALGTSTADGADLAEWIDYEGDTPAAGDILSLKEGGEIKVTKSGGRYSDRLVGIVSTQPHTIMGNESEQSTALALAGRVPVKVNTENGAIKAGDYITSSSISGVGMKAIKAGLVVGKALESYSGDGVGTITVLVGTQYFKGITLAQYVAGLNLTNTDEQGLALLNDFISHPVEVKAGDTTSDVFVDRVAAGLEIVTPRLFTQGLTVDYINARDKEIAFKNDTIFFGRPYFTTDTAGFAVVHKNDRRVEIVFDKSYLEQPIVNATISIESGTAAVEEALFAQNIQFVVTQKSTKGFTIVLNKQAPEDVTFSWTAFAVKGAKLFMSKPEAQPQQIQQTTPIQEVVPQLQPQTQSAPPSNASTTENTPSTSQSTNPAPDTTSSTTNPTNSPANSEPQNQTSQPSSPGSSETASTESTTPPPVTTPAETTSTAPIAPQPAPSDTSTSITAPTSP